jgi:thiol-disulfide isomerase/thioredoxin
MRSMAGRLAAIGIAAAMAAPAAGAELPMPPQLGSRAQADFESYRSALPGKAFVIGPGGAWGWQSDAASAEAAQASALATCNEHAPIACRPYARDGRLVFDAADWARAWRPYLGAGEAVHRPVGLMRGARFPSIEFKDGKGWPRTLADFRGKAVVLHFWGSWCGPCRHELPEIAAFARTLKGSDIAVVPLQVREDIAASRAWLKKQKIALPLYDSGMRSADDGDFRVTGGGRVPDRAVAPVFPSTVFLDRHGVIVFAHQGPIERWEDYRPQLTDLAQNSRR